MRTFWSARPSPALVISIIALVVALGGTSYAAFSVPRNSVGTAQLRKNAVTNKKIHNGAVTGAKIANGTITGKQLNYSQLGTVPSAANANALSGFPAGSFQGRVLWARVAPDGTLTANSGATSSAILATGEYEVLFNRAVTGCDYEATIGSSLVSNNAPFNDNGAGMILTEPRLDNPDGVFVATYSPTPTYNKTTGTFANPADNAFHLAVIC